jgi:hemolysin III
MATVPPERVKPRLRGVSHELAFAVSVGLGVALILSADGTRSLVAALIFASCVALMFGASALYHRPTWTPRARSWLARLDHAGIYLLIAGTYTPFGLLVLSRGWAIPLLTIVWTGAIAAILLKLFWVEAPKWLSAVLGISLGWVAVIALPELLKLDFAALVLLLLGGLLYTVGAIVYAFKRPDPVPHVFGYHELFHVLVIAAVGCQYAVIAFFVLR